MRKLTVFPISKNKDCQPCIAQLVQYDWQTMVAFLHPGISSPEYGHSKMMPSRESQGTSWNSRIPVDCARDIGNEKIDNNQIRQPRTPITFRRAGLKNFLSPLSTPSQYLLPNPREHKPRFLLRESRSEHPLYDHREQRQHLR